MAVGIEFLEILSEAGQSLLLDPRILNLAIPCPDVLVPIFLDLKTLDRVVRLPRVPDVRAPEIHDRKIPDEHVRPRKTLMPDTPALMFLVPIRADQHPSNGARRFQLLCDPGQFLKAPGFDHSFLIWVC